MVMGPKVKARLRIVGHSDKGSRCCVESRDLRLDAENWLALKKDWMLSVSLSLQF